MDGTGSEGLRPSPGFEALDAHVSFSCTRYDRSPADLHRRGRPLRLRVDWIRDRSPGTYLRGRSVMPSARPKTRQNRRRPTTPAQNTLFPNLANQQPFSRICASQLLRSVRVSPRLIFACSVLLQSSRLLWSAGPRPPAPPIVPASFGHPSANRQRQVLLTTNRGRYIPSKPRPRTARLRRLHDAPCRPCLLVIAKWLGKPAHLPGPPPCRTGLPSLGRSCRQVCSGAGADR